MYGLTILNAWRCRLAQSYLFLFCICYAKRSRACLYEKNQLEITTQYMGDYKLLMQDHQLLSKCIVMCIADNALVNARFKILYRNDSGSAC